VLRVLPEEAVLTIFWTLRIVGPMLDEGGGGLTRDPIPSIPPRVTRANHKESSDMKRAILPLLTVVALVAFGGCAAECGRRAAPCSCDNCAQAAEDNASCGQSCDNANDPNTCKDPARRHLCRFCRGRGCQECCQEACPAAAPGPPAGTITYPYYTVRGPRDFLAKNPPSIGP
jgi:hypothetical protein